MTVVLLLLRVGGEIDINAEYVSTSGKQQLPEAAVVVGAVALLVPLEPCSLPYLCFAGSHLACAVQPRIGT